ncbi:MAG: DUF998 domain-containing protein [Acidobacteria bacterium]|nr:DUF998 domain-containing protein [Acidobacteriota bacterium]
MRSPRALPALAAAAIVGQVALTASAWLLPGASEYGLLGDTISELVLGRYGWVQTMAFLCAGLGTIALALAVRALTTGTRGSLLGAALVGVYGAGALVSAAFPTDPIDSPEALSSLTTTGTIHVAASLVSFPSAVIFMFVFARTFGRDARWRPLAMWSGLCASGTLALLLVQAQGPLVGLLQRLMVGVVTVWLVMVAFRVRAIALNPTVGGAPVPG